MTTFQAIKREFRDDFHTLEYCVELLNRNVYGVSPDDEDFLPVHIKQSGKGNIYQVDISPAEYDINSIQFIPENFPVLISIDREFQSILIKNQGVQYRIHFQAESQKRHRKSQEICQIVPSYKRQVNSAAVRKNFKNFCKAIYRQWGTSPSLELIITDKARNLIYPALALIPKDSHLHKINMKYASDHRPNSLLGAVDFNSENPYALIQIDEINYEVHFTPG